MAFEERVEAAARWYDRGMQDLDSSISRLATVFDSKVVFDSPLPNKELVLHDVVHLVVGGWRLPTSPHPGHTKLVLFTDDMIGTLTHDERDDNEATTLAVELELLQRHGLIDDYFVRDDVSGIEAFWKTIAATGWKGASSSSAAALVRRHMLDDHDELCRRVELYIEELVERFCDA